MSKDHKGSRLRAQGGSVGHPLCCLLTPNKFRVSTVEDLRISQGFIDSGGPVKLPPEYGRLSWCARAKP